MCLKGVFSSYMRYSCSVYSCFVIFLFPEKVFIRSEQSVRRMEHKAETNYTICGKCVWKISMEKFGKCYPSKTSVHRNI